MGKILAIDQGTTGTTAALIDGKNFRFIDKETREFRQIYPAPGLVEHDLEDIWKTVKQTVVEVLKRNDVAPQDVQAIGIANQRETVCSFDSKGRPLSHALVWQDRRTTDACQKLKEQGHEGMALEKTGLPLDPYFSATKIKWMIENDKRVRNAAQKGTLRLGTIDTYLLYRFTGRRSFATEASNASRTLLMNLQTCDWDEELLDLFQLKRSFLPEIRDSFGLFGSTQKLDFLPDGIPITGILGDQQAALFGQAGHQKGEMKCTYGTGAFILLNTGDTIPASKARLFSTVAYRFEGHSTYALEGCCYIAGAAVQWLRDNLKIISSAAEIEDLAGQVKNLEEMEYLFFFPFFAGLASPYWRPQAKAAFVGITRDTSRPHLARACLEGVALSIDDLISTMKKDTGMPLTHLKVDGGMVANDLLMGIQATLSQTTIIRSKVEESTAYGAALAAAIGQGLLSLSDIGKLWKKDKEFTPIQKDAMFYQKKKAQWMTHVHRMFL